MGPNSPFALLFKDEVMAKLTILPIALQYAKAVLGWFPTLAANAGPITGVLAFAIGVGLAVWGGMEAKLDPMSIAGQAAIAFAYVQAFYWTIVAPVASSSNPIIPANPPPTGSAPRPATIALVLAMLGVLAAGLAFGQSSPAPAKVFAAYIGGNANWTDGVGKVEWEPETSARASLSPHISLVGSGAYGARAKSWRYAGGIRITATDENDPNFSIGIGAQYHGSDSKGFKPDEWKPDVTIGMRPWPIVAGQRPSLLNNIIFILRGWVGIDSKVPGGIVGARYKLPL